MTAEFEQLSKQLSRCDICRDRFSKTHTAHHPRPVVWFRPSARILIAGQAPGMKVYQSGRPFTDPSGDRLRDWMGVSETVFYDRDKIAIVPMAFCFPGYNAKGSDLPPPQICAKTWHDRVMTFLPDVSLTLLIGGHSQKRYLAATARGGVTETVLAWRNHAPSIFPLPHPSWRNNAWIKRNPWFDRELLPELKQRVSEVLG